MVNKHNFPSNKIIMEDKKKLAPHKINRLKQLREARKMETENIKLSNMSFIN